MTQEAKEIMETLISLFEKEISNKIEYFDNKIIVYLSNEKKVIITTKNVA